MSDAAIRDAINMIAGNNLTDKVYAIDATVISVDETKRMAKVQVVSGKANNSFDVRLMASLDDGVLLIPAVDSTVCVILSDFTAPYISQYSELDKVLIISGSSAVEIKNGLIKLNDGSYGGLVKISDLTSEINNRINAINQQLVLIATGITTAGGSYTPTALQTMNKSMYENTKITHGQ